ncbi:MAG TPA: hypothetical protein VJ941_09400, partial [Gracilimonas sp.]|nr:hypothetical protein [Gracilimonas sp.]
MQDSLHTFSIPVMGTGHSIDSPIRVAPFGINSVISIVDDLLVERIRKYYSGMFDLPYKNIARNAEDGRARRITAYLDMVHDLVQTKFEEIKDQSFFEDNDKARYFEMLPSTSEIRKLYMKLIENSGSEKVNEMVRKLTDSMKVGSIDVNIMAKVDGFSYTNNGQPMTSEFSDGSAALRGYANSKLSSSLILSAGFNPRL